MKSRRSAPESRRRKPVIEDLKDIGRRIEHQIKDGVQRVEEEVEKGLNRVEEIFKDNKNADDKLFSYFKAFIDDKGVASVTPSSKYIINRVLRAMDLAKVKTVIEYGAAEGVITRRMLDLLPAHARVIAIELNDELYEGLRKIKDSRLIPVHGDVREVDQIVRRYGIERADVIVSGIPFAFLSGRGRHELMSKTHGLLEPHGRFVAYQVTTHLIHMLDDYFRKVKTEFEIRNLPPHFVFTAFK